MRESQPRRIAPCAQTAAGQHQRTGVKVGAPQTVQFRPGLDAGVIHRAIPPVVAQILQRILLLKHEPPIELGVHGAAEGGDPGVR